MTGDVRECQVVGLQSGIRATGATSETAVGGILGKEGVVAWYDLDAAMWTTPAKSEGKQRRRRTSLKRYDFELGFRRDIAATALDHLVSPDVDLLVEPRSSTECAHCGFREYCFEILEQGSGDTSLLPGINYQNWRHLRDRGIVSRGQVADLDYPTAKFVKDGVDVARFRVLADSSEPDVPIRRRRSTLVRLALHKANVAGIRITRRMRHDHRAERPRLSTGRH